MGLEKVYPTRCHRANFFDHPLQRKQHMMVKVHIHRENKKNLITKMKVADALEVHVVAITEEAFDKGTLLNIFAKNDICV